jgi:glycosyltransferase involved in cell wall biosynthesis
MKVSIVVPTYNRAYIIREALESILMQSFPDFEAVVVDDGSTDSTHEVIGGLEDDRIHYLRHERNRGCSAAYNTGMRAAAGEVIAFLDSDDVWKPGYLERQIEFLSRHPEVGVVFTDTEVVGGAEPIASLSGCMPRLQSLLASRAKTKEYVFSAREMYLCLLEEVPIKPSATVVRREILHRVGMFDEAWPSGTDWDLFLRLSRVGHFGYIDRVLATQRRTGDETHQMFLEQDKLFLLGVFLKEKATLVDDREALRGINRGICGLYNSLAWYYLQSGHHKEALSTYWRGFKETLQPKLLRKLASAVLRTAFLFLDSKKNPKRYAPEIPLTGEAVRASEARARVVTHERR